MAEDLSQVVTVIGPGGYFGEVQICSNILWDLHVTRNSVSACRIFEIKQSGVHEHYT